MSTASTSIGPPSSRPPLLALFGSGASVPCGIADTATLTHNITIGGTIIVTSVGYKIANSHDDYERPSEERWWLTSMLWEALRGTYAKPDFETYIHALETLEPFAASRRQSNAINNLDEWRPVAAAYMEVLGRYEPFMRADILRKERLDVIKRIVESLRTSPESIAFDPQARAARTKLAAFFKRLHETHAATTLTLNYDDLLDQILDRQFDGFLLDSGNGAFEFDPVAFLQAQVETPEPMLLHLHGSARFGYLRKDDGKRLVIAKYPDREAALVSIRGELTLPDAGRGDTAFGGVVHAITPIISGAQKADKLMLTPSPFGYYYHAAVSQILKHQRFIVIGYGCRDPHINTWVHEAATISGDRFRLVFVTLLPPGRRGFTTPDQSVDFFLYPISADSYNAWNSHGEEILTFGSRLMVIRSGFPLADPTQERIERFLAS